MSSSTLPPDSRYDAIAVFTVSLASALLGATPGESKRIAIVLTILGNAAAIFTSVVSFQELLDESSLETHLRFFVMVLLVLTLVSSSLSLLSLVFCKRVDRLVILGGIYVPLLALVFGIGALCFAFFQGLTLVLCGAVAATVVIGFFVFKMVDKYGHSSAGTLPVACVQLAKRNESRNTKENDGVDAPPEYRYLRDALAESDSPQPHSPGSALVTRLSALVKACLLGVYWLLVDGGLPHDAFTFEQHDATAWVNGQYAKQGIAIANNIFNCLPC